MAKDAYDSGVTQEQRKEIRELCRQAQVPDKSGEMFTQESAGKFIEDLRAKISDQSRPG